MKENEKKKYDKPLTSSLAEAFEKAKKKKCSQKKKN